MTILIFERPTKSKETPTCKFHKVIKHSMIADFSSHHGPNDKTLELKVLIEILQKIMEENFRL